MATSGSNENSAGGLTPDLFALAPCAMLVCDRRGWVQTVNQAFARLVGWPSTTPPAAGKFTELLTRPSQYVFGSQVMPPLHLAGAVQEIELDIIDQDGGVHAVLLNGVQLGEAEQGGLHYFSLTETKARRAYEREQLAAQSLLERRQEYLDLAERLARVGHWYVDLTSRESFWSPEVYVIHGLVPRTSKMPDLDQIIELYHADDRDAVRASIVASIASKQPFSFQKRLAATQSRGERIVEAHGQAEYGATGAATGVFGVLRDVTASVTARHELEMSRERYRLLADNVPGLISYWDSQQRCRFINRAYLEWFGRSPESLLGHSLAVLLGPEQYEHVAPHVLGVLDGQAQTFEGVITRATGEIGYTLVRYVPDHDADGAIRGFHALVTDVTELKQRNLADQASNALKSAVLSSTNYLVIATTPDGVVTVFNTAAEAALGYRAEEVIGRPLPLRWQAPETAAATAASEQPEPGARQSRPSWPDADARELSLVRRDGTRFPVRLSITPLQYGNGEISGFVGVIEDITERIKAEEALRSSEETFRIAMEHASNGVTIHDASGQWLRVNKAIAQMLGYSQHELLAQNHRAVTHPDDLAASDQLMDRLMSGEIETGSIEKRYLRKDGTAVWAQLSAAAVRHPNGTTQYVIAQVQDITERREIERVKSEFIATVSHELRTPVTAIRGALGLVTGTMTDALPADVSKLVLIADKNSKRLLLLINDMLDIDTMASGKMRFDVGVHPVDSLVAAAIEDNQPYADRFDARIVAPEAKSDLWIAVDAGRFAQIMSNLLSNAAKFSPRGGRVDVLISRRGDTCRVAVCDQGEGIPASFAPQLFGKFSQADVSASRRKSGSGLGLHISRSLAEHMGGSLGYDSLPTCGATFWVEFPVADRQPVE